MPQDSDQQTQAPAEDELFQPPTRKAGPVSRATHAVIGVILIVIGVILAILPVVPGFPLIAIGVLMLAAASEPSRRFLNRTEHRFPAWLRRFLRRVVGHHHP